MRVIAKWFPRGEVRVIHCPDKPPPPKTVAADVALVNSCELQDCISAECSPDRAGYGSLSRGTAFGKGAKSTIRDAGALLDADGIDKLLFVTLTLPGGSDTAMKALAEWSAWAVSRFFQWVRDNWRGAQWCGVWEWQKRGALHIHACIKLDAQEDRLDFSARLKKRWIAILRGIEKRAHVDLFERADGGTWSHDADVTVTQCAPVKKSVARYLAKYMSKGSMRQRKAAYYPPSRWWFISRGLATLVQTERRELQLPLLPASLAQELFVQLVERVAAKVEFAATYQSPVDSRFQAVVVAGAVPVVRKSFDDVSLLFAAWGLPFTLSSTVAATLSDVASFFMGKIYASDMQMDGTLNTC